MDVEPNMYALFAYPLKAAAGQQMWTSVTIDKRTATHKAIICQLGDIVEDLIADFDFGTVVIDFKFDECCSL